MTDRRGDLTTAESNTASRWEAAFHSRLTYFAAQIGSGVILALIALFGERMGPIPFAFSLIIYLVAVIPLHYFMHETTVQIEARANAKARAKWRQSGVDDDIHYRATEFLIQRMRAIMDFRGCEREAQVIGGTAPNSHRLERINETLAALCSDLSSVAAKSLDIPMSEAWFRATFMEVQDVSGAKRLVYVGWHTQDGNMPRSMADGITMGKGERVAGLSWERNRPVIEANFEDGHEWVNNYTNQGRSYKSMVSAPVQKGCGDDMNTVIGVITVDTGIKSYFGAKNTRADEDRAGAMVRPYATYIAVLYALG